MVFTRKHWSEKLQKGVGRRQKRMPLGEKKSSTKINRLLPLLVSIAKEHFMLLYLEWARDEVHKNTKGFPFSSCLFFFNISNSITKQSCIVHILPLTFQSASVISYSSYLIHFAQRMFRFFSWLLLVSFYNWRWQPLNLSNAFQRNIKLLLHVGHTAKANQFSCLFAWWKCLPYK